MTATDETTSVQWLGQGGGGRWHVPTGGPDGEPSQVGACGAQLVSTDLRQTSSTPEHERCQTPACKRLWRPDPRWSGQGAVPRDDPHRPRPQRDEADGPANTRAPLDDIDMDGDDRPLNPVETEAGIRKVARMLHRGVFVVTKAEEDFRTKDREYERAFAQAYLGYDGAAHAKKYAAEVATQQLRAERDVLELAFNHAARLQRNLERQLDAVRSVNTSVREMYRAEAGVGR